MGTPVKMPGLSHLPGKDAVQEHLEQYPLDTDCESRQGEEVAKIVRNMSRRTDECFEPESLQAVILPANDRRENYQSIS